MAEIKETDEAPWPEESKGTSIEAELEKALEREEFEIYYQPIAEVANGKTAGVEALLRWYSPELGLLHPDRFISLAERTGLIIPIGEWVLYKACSRYKAW